MAISRTGPLTKDEKTLAVGLAQVRVGSFSDNVNNLHPALGDTDSIGALANTKLTSEVEYLDFQSGFPKLTDKTIPLSENALLDCAFYEFTPVNLALAKGKDINSGEYATMSNYSGEMPLGAMVAPDNIRMEAKYTFPDGDTFMYIIFPKAQVKSSVEVDLQDEDWASSPVQFVAQRADSQISGGSSVWDDKPLGRVGFYDADQDA